MLRRSKWVIPMVARWDVMLLAAVLGGGSMLIENSHRLDTGAPDEEMLATSTCEAGDIWKPTMLPSGDDADQTDAAPAPASDCS